MHAPKRANSPLQGVRTEFPIRRHILPRSRKFQTNMENGVDLEYVDEPDRARLVYKMGECVFCIIGSSGDTAEASGIYRRFTRAKNEVHVDVALGNGYPKSSDQTSNGLEKIQAKRRLER